jgi:hypothetical protein
MSPIQTNAGGKSEQKNMISWTNANWTQKSSFVIQSIGHN